MGKKITFELPDPQDAATFDRLREEMEAENPDLRGDSALARDIVTAYLRLVSLGEARH